MRNRLWSIVILSGLLSAGCGKTGVIRAPTQVVAEEPAAPVIRIARATPEEQPAPQADTPAATEPVAFPFTDDRGGKLLRNELTRSRSLPEPAAQPRPAKLKARLEAPELPLPPSYVGPAALPPRQARKVLLPRLATPEMLVGLALGLPLPEAKPLPAGARTKEASVDVKEPAPLPILSQPLPDRASLADATGEASDAAVVVATMPVRQQPLPFQRLSVPDPFENYRPLLLSLPEESTGPATASPRTPSPK